MSLQTLLEHAKKAPGAFVKTTGRVLAAALHEFQADPAVQGSLYEHVLTQLKLDPECEMQVHRDVHIGDMLKRAAAAALEQAVNLIVEKQVAPGPIEAVKEPPAMTPGTSTLET